MNKKSIQRIMLFYLIGIFLSNVFRFDLFHIRESTDTLNILLVSLIAPLGAIGLLLGALISLHLLKKERVTQYSQFTKVFAEFLSVIYLLNLVFKTHN